MKFTGKTYDYPTAIVPRTSGEFMRENEKINNNVLVTKNTSSGVKCDMSDVYSLIDEQSPDKLVNLPKKHNHYFKDVSHLKTVDVYRVLDLFNVTDPSIAHAAKKLLVAGGRGTKDINKDIQECIDSLVRWQEMQTENISRVQV
jgi:hypothetical protein